MDPVRPQVEQIDGWNGNPSGQRAFIGDFIKRKGPRARLRPAVETGTVSGYRDDQQLRR